MQLQERLSLLQVKSDLLSSVFGQEKADDLLEELSGDMRKRELLHSQLLQRKNRLQVPYQPQLKILLLYIDCRLAELHQQSLPPPLAITCIGLYNRKCGQSQSLSCPAEKREALFVGVNLCRQIKV